MKKILKILIPVVILGALVYQFRVPLSEKALPVWNLVRNQFFPLAPCTEPIPYTLGTFDTKFGISQTYFLNALAEAEAIWEKPFGKELFSYEKENKSTDVLKVNLIYDYRQQATSKLASLGIVVENNKSSYESLKSKFIALKKELDTAKSNYNREVESFNKEQADYEKQVKYWNARGGAPSAEYKKLQSEKSALEVKATHLEASQKKINDMVDEINALVVVLNRLASTLNISVDKYNTVGASRGESFEEGVYSSDGLNREIDIYEFSSRGKLVRVLAHELGHALGLDHVDDAKAIMYKLNQGNNETLTTADLSALKTRCGIK